MNDFLTQILPGTRALIWLPKQEIEPSSLHYRRIDYLCDGILTSSLSSLKDKNSLVLLSNNFGTTLLIYIAKSVVDTELKSFIGLIPKDRDGEILVIDDSQQLDSFKKLLPKDISSKVRQIS